MTGFEPDFSANFRNWTDRPPQARKFSGCGLEIKEIDVKSDRPIGQFLPQFQKSDRPPSRTRFCEAHGSPRTVPPGAKVGHHRLLGRPQVGHHQLLGCPRVGHHQSQQSQSPVVVRRLRKMVGRIDRGRSRKRVPRTPLYIYIYIPLIWS